MEGAGAATPVKQRTVIQLHEQLELKQRKELGQLRAVYQNEPKEAKVVLKDIVPEAGKSALMSVDDRLKAAKSKTNASSVETRLAETASADDTPENPAAETAVGGPSGLTIKPRGLPPVLEVGGSSAENQNERIAAAMRITSTTSNTVSRGDPRPSLIAMHG